MYGETSSERSGASHRVRGTRGHVANAHHQPTAATEYYANLGDTSAQNVVRSMYSPTPSLTAATDTRRTPKGWRGPSDSRAPLEPSRNHDWE